MFTDESDVRKYKIEQDEKEYILSTSLAGDKIRVIITEPDTSAFHYGEYTLEQFRKIHRTFAYIQSINQIKDELNQAIESENIALNNGIGGIILNIFFGNGPEKIKVIIGLAKMKDRFMQKMYTGEPITYEDIQDDIHKYEQGNMGYSEAPAGYGYEYQYPQEFNQAPPLQEQNTETPGNDKSQDKDGKENYQTILNRGPRLEQGTTPNPGQYVPVRLNDENESQQQKLNEKALEEEQRRQELEQQQQYLQKQLQEERLKQQLELQKQQELQRQNELYRQQKEEQMRNELMKEKQLLYEQSRKLREIADLQARQVKEAQERMKREQEEAERMRQKNNEEYQRQQQALLQQKQQQQEYLQQQQMLQLQQIKEQQMKDEKERELRERQLKDQEERQKLIQEQFNKQREELLNQQRLLNLQVQDFNRKKQNEEDEYRKSVTELAEQRQLQKTLEDRIRQQQEEIQRQNERAREMEKKIQELINQSNQNKNISQPSSEELEKLKQMEENNQKMRQEKEELKNIIGKLKAESDFYKNQTNQLKGSTDLAEEKLNYFKKENELKSLESNKLKSDNQELKNINEQLRQTLEDQRQKLKELEDQQRQNEEERERALEDMRKENERKLADKDKEIEGLRESQRDFDEKNVGCKESQAEVNSDSVPVTVSKPILVSSSANTVPQKEGSGEDFISRDIIVNETIQGNIIKDMKELDMLTKKINKTNSTVFYNLLYKATVDGDTAEAFHRKCDDADSTLVLIEDTKGHRFGGYTSKSWRGDSVDKKDDEAFVFSLNLMETYDIKPGQDAIGCYAKYGPVFFGCQIRIYDKFLTKGGTTYKKNLNYQTTSDFVLTGGEQKFDVKEIEVYEVKLN